MKNQKLTISDGLWVEYSFETDYFNYVFFHLSTIEKVDYCQRAKMGNNCITIFLNCGEKVDICFDEIQQAKELYTKLKKALMEIKKFD